jgi:hypothetical protein
MFRSAVAVATAAARSWTPEAAEPPGCARCCELCLRRYRVLVLDGPLRDLPHAVAHAAVEAIDDLIAERLVATEEQHAQAAEEAGVSAADRAEEMRRRLSAARGALVMVALEDLTAAGSELVELRRRYTEPAIAGFVARQHLDDVPSTWF